MHGKQLFTLLAECNTPSQGYCGWKQITGFRADDVSDGLQMLGVPSFVPVAATKPAGISGKTVAPKSDRSLALAATANNNTH